MKNYFKDGWTVISNALFKDNVNIYLVLGTVVLGISDSLIWKFVLIKRELFVDEHLGIYPLGYLVVVLIINTALGLFSYDKEKEISYLLLSANAAASLLIFILEIFYLLNS